MAYKVNSLEEMPNALSYLIESVEALQSKGGFYQFHFLFLA